LAIVGFHPIPTVIQDSVRSKKEIYVASKAFAKESRWRSWMHVVIALALYAFCTAVLCSPAHWAIKLLASVASGLLIVRGFIMYHDYHHGAILKKSLAADLLFTLYGWLSLSPASVWRDSHNHHHQHNSKSTGFNPGSFPLMTCSEFRNASRAERWNYIVSRHWLTMLFGCLTVFLYGMCLRPFFSNPKSHWDGGVAALLNLSLLGGLLWISPPLAVWLVVLPLGIACGLGSYLFYAQHNFPDCQLFHHEQWSHAQAAMSSSSFIRMSGVMHWFTGNVGYHHIHHLNAKIPFYRLPEAMRRMPELQSPGTTSLLPMDVWSCLKLNLWDADQQRLVSYREAMSQPRCMASGDGMV